MRTLLTITDCKVVLLGHDRGFRGPLGSRRADVAEGADASLLRASRSDSNWTERVAGKRLELDEAIDRGGFSAEARTP